MHDPKFEKEVQQKMEGLIFDPPEVVWLNLEKALNRKKRRPAPVFWLFLFTGIVLTAAGGAFLVMNKKTHNPVSQTKEAGIVMPADNTVKAGPSAPSQTPGKELPAIQSPGTDASLTQPAQPASTPDGSVRAGTRRPATPGALGAPSAARHSLKEEKDQTHSGGVEDGQGHSGEAPGATNDPDPRLAQTSSLPVHRETAQERNYLVVNPSLINLSLSHQDPSAIFPRPGRDAARINTGASQKKVVGLTKPKRPWQAGFAGGGGISSMNQALFEPSKIVAASNAFALRGSPVTAVNAANTQHSISSRVRPDLSFWAGILAQKPLSNRLNLSLGLNLHYYSTKIRTGGKVDGASANNNPTFYDPLSLSSLSIAAAAAPPPPYYPTGDNYEFTNRYYFLEVPVNLQWQVNKSKVMPMFLEGGLSFSYLVSSDALYYNTRSKVYYKDGSTINRTQLNASTAFLIGLPLWGNRMQVGPQLQYGITQLLNEQVPGDGHLFYGGIKVVVFPNKGGK